MKPLHTLGLLFLVSAPLLSRLPASPPPWFLAVDAAPTDDTLRTALRAVAKAQDLWAKDALWPETSKYPVPVALRVDDQTAYLIGHPKPPPGMKKASEAKGALKWTGHSLPPAATSVEVNGTPTAVVPLDMVAGHSEAEAVGLVAHEMFHALQAIRGFGAAENIMLLPEYPELDPRNNALGRVEGELLADALHLDGGVDSGVSADQPGSREWDGAINFLAVRKLRRQSLSSSLQEYERLVEAHEGVPQLIQMLAPPLIDLGTNPARTDLPFALRTLCEGGRGTNRRRFYTSGAALSLLLSRINPEWKRQHMKGRALEDLLAEAIKFDPATASAKAESLVKNPHFEQLLAEETAAAEAERKRRQARLEALKREAPRLLVLDLGGQAVQRYFDPMNVTQAGDGVTIHERFLQLQGDGWSLRVTGVPVIEETKAQRYTIPITELGAMTMGGVTIERPQPSQPLTHITDLKFTAPGIELIMKSALLDSTGDGKTTRLQIPLR